MENDSKEKLESEDNESSSKNKFVESFYEYIGVLNEFIQFTNEYFELEQSEDESDEE